MGAEDPDPTETIQPVSGIEAMSSDAFLREIAATPRAIERRDLSGERIAHFQLEELLGRGGMGEVYAALDDKLRRRVALKVLPPEVVGDAERRARFLREARAAAAVTHSHIVTIYEVGEDDDHVFIAMEHVAGGSLRERLARDGALPVEEAVSLWRAMLRGVRKAHAAGIVHRDLKPDNVMLTDEGEVKVLDFGLAKLREGDGRRRADGSVDFVTTEEGRVMGTPGYMSPEQAKGAAVDHRTDLFALGVVAYEMITGERPFPGDSSMEVLVATARDEPARPSSLRRVPARLDAVIMRCLEKQPGNRFADADAVLEALAAPLLEADAPSGTKRWLVVAGVAALLGGAAWAWLPREPSHAPSPSVSAQPEPTPTQDEPASTSTGVTTTAGSASAMPTTSASVAAPPPPREPRPQPRPRPHPPAPPAPTASGKVNLGI